MPDNFIISEIHAEKSLNRICNLWRTAFLHENCATHKCTMLKCWNDMFVQKRFIAYTTNGTGNKTLRTYPFEKNGLTISYAVKLLDTVTFSEGRGTG
ncbi:hypothetical protein AVEN_40202-1 [Araneus ventricosus]|uniref:Uncharacterized protein n=1 Tax=Araneus ventricosus TaxID=182803 RepID=A0A4Y2LTP6_ARAVE|nr:hypothetical protein AVEN_40202-1 [Araneus ventricosus]